uniref:ATP-dependent DNA helicase mph1 n=1 Tax=Anthurium amnicola TaxID=1678845 RepID=A0A1D1Z151_9ARAE
MELVTKQGEGEEEREVSPWDCGSPLYDSFELASLCHVLDRHLMALPTVSGDSARPTGRWSDDASQPARHLATSKMTLVRSREEEKKSLWGWKRGKHSKDGNKKKKVRWQFWSLFLEKPVI